MTALHRQIAFVLLACYALVLFRPLGHCIADALAHTFWETAHVATVHYENGKYHLHVELKKAADETSTPASQAAKNASEETAGVHLPGETAAIVFPVSSPAILITENERFPLPFYASVIPPPPWRS